MAAGKGTRMGGDLPKVVHPVGGRSMVCAVVEACRAAGCGRVVVIVGYKQELVREALRGFDGVEFAVQGEQLGTGHAVQCAEAEIRSARTSEAPHDTFVLAGDGPLIRAETLRMLMERHRSAKASATLATATIDDPTGYGRIVRDAAGKFRAIVEHKNSSDEQRKIREVNPSYYCFQISDLFEALKRVQRNPLSGEYYLTDTLEVLLKQGKRVEVAPGVPAEDILSINTPAELSIVDRIYRGRHGHSSATAVAGGRA